MLSVLTFAAAAAATPQPNCENQKFGFEMASCSYRAFKTADAEMNKQWQTVLEAMRKLDKHIDPKTDRTPHYADTLLAAQRAWLIFRDQHCLLVSFDARGGNSTQLMLLNQCKEELTKARTKQLKSLVE